jgi:hypothetical protein
MAKKWLFALLIAIICFGVTTFVWANVSNATVIRKWVMAGGGGRITSGTTNLEGTLGQPLAYQTSSGGTELCAGFWCGARGEYQVFLPAVLNNVFTCFAGQEVEPNNTPDQANGPLCFNADITGKPDSPPGDYFYFDWPASGTFTVRATNFDSKGQMQLFIPSNPTPIVAGDQDSGIYQITYNGAAGRYYVRLISVTSPVGTQTYTLRVNTP